MRWTHRRFTRPHIAFVAFALVGLSACSSTSGNGGQTDMSTAQVVRVVDGDTIVLKIGSRRETIRLIGVNTPETVKPNWPVECFGPEASAFAKSLLPAGTLVRIKRDVEARDKYGRLLLYVWRSIDDMFVNLELVRGGYARTMSIKPNASLASDFAQASLDAKNAHRGLWAACSG